MTVNISEIVNLYKQLLIVQYADKPKAQATIELYINELLADGIYWEVNDAYNIDTAVGVQLDILGKYIGLTRDYNGLLLSDDDYRFLLLLKIAKNYTNHSTYEIATDLFRLFDDEVIMIDNFNMSISYFASPTLLATAIIARNKKCLPKPAGVNINLIEINDYFVYGNYNDNSEVIGFGFADYTDSDVQGGDFSQYNNIF